MRRRTVGLAATKGMLLHAICRAIREAVRPLAVAVGQGPRGLKVGVITPSCLVSSTKLK